MKKMSVEPYKGVRDFYPEDQALLQYFIDTCRAVAEKVGYVEYGASVLEPSELYKNKNAENEEIINEQTYTFTDRGGREVTLRPEMTPTVARMVAGRRREFGFPLRLYCVPNFFRYERPQRGRLREFWQLNVDLFGSNSPAADAEVLAVAYGLMAAFGARESDFVIKVGSRQAIQAITQENNLDEEQTKKFFALLDRRAKISEVDFDLQLKEFGINKSLLSPQNVPQDIAKMIADFAEAGINNIVYDPSVVRGFAYYSGMVFEVFDTHPDNGRAIFGGGRYDNLTALFDDEPLPGVGFGMGYETMRLFMESRGLLPAYTPPTQVYFAVTAPDLALQAQTLAGGLRRGGVNAAVDFGERKLGDQIKAAAKNKIPWLIVVGEDELASGRFKVKNLASGAEETVAEADLPQFFLNLKS
ncbi:histidine--tRNA ligase [Candidatus Kaiserbacteria bacterium RIFCSPLOWO2_01_FULL_54_20]|uniref:Histidine--tRNA ligase n=1 Tax=Candidatus Kaiserbacteria bacterium RIFCSPLOWO2_01_FULL_54_20 TaxID=1798513 RepID=A0A1F6EIJ2_9BACT|nr:MAG: histidine--tRNA ligase [Candidatus Kaiserbacteria bacterium RIFCSPLOWO2_01_FULL_54_20]